jgi:hypothetical protein
MKVPGRYGGQVQAARSGYNHGMKPLSLPNDGFTLLNAELNSKQLKERT